MDEIVGECVNDPEQRPNPISKFGSQISGDADEERWRIFVTGHSMGGAKATLCAYELAVSHCRAWPLPVHGNGWYTVAESAACLSMEGRSQALPQRHNNCALCLPDWVEHLLQHSPSLSRPTLAACNSKLLATGNSLGGAKAMLHACELAVWISMSCKPLYSIPGLDSRVDGKSCGYREHSMLSRGHCLQTAGMLKACTVCSSAGQCSATLAGQGVEECARAKGHNGQLRAAASGQHALCPGLRYIACASCLPA